MVDVAGLTVNLNSSTSDDGSDGSSGMDENEDEEAQDEVIEKLEGIQEATEGIFDVIASIRNLNLAGVAEGLGGLTGAGGGGLTSLLGGGIGASAVGAGGLIGSLTQLSGSTVPGGPQRRATPQSFFQPFRNEETGERKVAQISKRNGDILDVLSQREAKQRGILNEEGDLKGVLETERKQYEEIAEVLPKYKDTVSTNQDELERVSSAIVDKGRVMDEIVRKLKSFRDSIPKSFNEGATGGRDPSEFGSSYTPPSERVARAGAEEAVFGEGGAPNTTPAQIVDSTNDIFGDVQTPVDLESQFKNN